MAVDDDDGGRELVVSEVRARMGLARPRESPAAGLSAQGWGSGPGGSRLGAHEPPPARRLCRPRPLKLPAASAWVERVFETRCPPDGAGCAARLACRARSNPAPRNAPGCCAPPPQLNALRHARDPLSNPAGNAFSESETDLTTTWAAVRQPSAESARVWRIKNAAKRHPFTQRPVAYHLYPAPVSAPSASSRAGRPAGPLWGLLLAWARPCALAWAAARAPRCKGPARGACKRARGKAGGRLQGAPTPWQESLANPAMPARAARPPARPPPPSLPAASRARCCSRPLTVRSRAAGSSRRLRSM
jgi:hypothetical protein